MTTSAKHPLPSADSPPQIIVNGPHPGFCGTALFRGVPSIGRLFVAFALFLFGRTSEQGARTVVTAAIAGPETHGRYMCDSKIGNEAPYVLSDEAEVVGRKAWEELKVILEGIEPGVTANI